MGSSTCASHPARTGTTAVHRSRIGATCQTRIVFDITAGYEVSNTFIGLPTPNGWAAVLDPHRRWLARCFNNVVHHDLHSRHNYSLYFTLWDRLCGTLHPDTDRVDEYVREPARARPAVHGA